MEIRFATNEIEVSSPWDEWDEYVLGRKRVESLVIPVLYNPSLMAHSFATANSVPGHFLSRDFPTWRLWTQPRHRDGSMCIEFEAGVSRMGLSTPIQTCLLYTSPSPRDS